MFVDLIIFYMPNFDVILGIDFMSWYEVEINSRKKKVWFHLDDGEEFTFSKGHMLNMMINDIKARKMLHKGCTSYMMHVISKVDGLVLSLQSTSIACEF